jgi:hypothetical protein
MVRGALIIAPLRPAYLVWPAEVKKWTEFSGLSVAVLHGPDKDKKLKQDHDIYVINPEGLPWLEAKLRTMKSWPFDMLVVDESSQFKNSTTVRFTTLKKLLDRFRRRYILTGTPAPRSLLDLYGQMYLLDMGASLGFYYSHFRSKYFYQSDYLGFKWDPMPGAEQRIYNALGNKVLRMDARDYLELPELIFNDVWVTLPKDARKAYYEMEKVLCTQIEAGMVTAANAGVAMGKCRQIASGGIFITEDKWEHIHDEKTKAVEELLDGLSGKPALIAYEYRHDLARLLKALGDDTPYIGGGVSTQTATAAARKWNAGELSALLGQPQSMAHGLNLQESGGAVIWHTLTFNYENYDQFIRRVYRQGNTEQRVVVHRILAEGTVDEDVVRALETKENNQNALFSALKSRLHV